MRERGKIGGLEGTSEQIMQDLKKQAAEFGFSSNLVGIHSRVPC